MLNRSNLSLSPQRQNPPTPAKQIKSTHCQLINLITAVLVNICNILIISNYNECRRLSVICLGVYSQCSSGISETDYC